MQNEILGLQELPEQTGETGVEGAMITTHTSSISVFSDCMTRTIATTW